jgi:phospholipase/carboxylesterase
VMTLDVGLRYPTRFAGLTALSGYLAEPAAIPAELSPAQRATPVFIAHGTLDQVVPLAGSRQAAQVLRAAGLPVDLREYPMAHQITHEVLEDLSDFLRRVLAL